jgi:two-component system, cell cycle sensor histidine kinase and response regulator CckA
MTSLDDADLPLSGIASETLPITGEQTYRDIFDAIHDALLLFDGDGRIVDVNDRAYEMFGPTRQSIIGQHIEDLSSGSSSHARVELMQKIQLAIEAGPQVLEWQCRRHDGQLFWSEVALRTAQIAGQDLLIASIRDISGRKATEEALRASEERLRMLSSIATEGVMIHRDGVIIDANQAFANLIGASGPHELIAKSGLDIIGFTPVSRAIIVELMQSMSEEPADIEIERPDGSKIPAETWSRNTTFRGQPARLVYMRDITERRRTEEELKRNERRLALAVTATADAIWERNLLTDETYYSPRWYEMLGYQDQQFPMNHHTWKMLCHPDDLRPALDCIQATLSSPQSNGYEAEYRMRAADGSWVWILGRGNVVEWDDEGRPLILSGTNTDVTERKRAEEALAENEHRFRLMIQNFNDMLLILDREGTERFVSPACERILGFLPRVLVGQSVYSLIHPEDVTRVNESMDSLISSKDRTIVIEFRHIHCDGSYRWLEASGTNLVDDPAIGGFVLVVRDITQRRQSEVETAEWKHRYDLLAAAAGNVVYDYQSGGNVVWGGGFRGMFGFEPEAMLGGFSQWIERIHPDDRERVQRSFAEAEANGTVFKAEYRHVDRDGHYVLVEDTGYPYFDENGSVERSIGVLVDITARKKADEENARLAESLRQAQKMESIGRLAGGVAHDFNNLLTVISGNVSLAMMELQPNDPLHESMMEVVKAVESAANLTRQLLAFSRKQVIDPKVLNLNSVVEHLQKLLRRLLGEDIELRSVLPQELGQVRIDPGQVEQIIVNLAVNARDAMPDGGVLTLETANVTLDESYCPKYGNVQPGDYVMLAVSDNGSGISPDVKAHLFEPFFTTKEQGKGTGLGLAMVYGAVTQHKGTIEVYSELGCGTTFKILLPRVDEQPEQIGTPSSATLPRGAETIFLVEDDDMVRDLAVRLLKRQGYRTFAFSNGGEALMAVADIADDVHLLITDVVMPGVNGRVLAQNLRSLRPGLKVLFTSGYTGDVIVHHGVLDKGIEFIAKPYSLEQLAKRVRAVLDK